MFDLSLERDFLTIWLLFMGIVFCYGLWIWGKMKREMTQSRKALEDLKRWSRRYPEFSAGVYHGGEAAEISDPTLNPKTRKWLKQFRAGHRQNKPPIVDEVIGKEEDHLCNNDDTLRTISGSLIILGLLGTFIGLFLVIIPIQSIIQNTQDIIQNTQDSAKTTGPAAAQSMTEMLKKIGGSLSGMKFAFLTSIVGLGLMIVLNFLFSIFIGKKRHVLLDELETHFNEDIAPRFRLFSPETQLEEAVNRAFESLADRHSEFMAGQEDYLKRALEAHFEKIVVSLEPLLQTLGDTSDTFKAASASSQRASEIWQQTLDDFSDQHSQFMADQGNYLKRALEAHFEKIVVSLEPLLQTLHRASDILNAASDSYYRVSEIWQKTLDDFSARHSQFMADQGNYLKRALEAHFEKIVVSLEPLLQTLHRASDILNAASDSYYRVSEDWSATFSQGAEAVREAGEAFVKHISNFTKLSEPLEELKAAVEKMVGDFEKRIDALALTMGETYQVLQKLNPDEPPYQLVFDHIKARLDAIHNTEQDLLRFQQVSNREDEAGIDERGKALRQSLLSVESAIEDLKETLVENLTVVNQTLNDFPEVLRQQRRIIGLLTDMDVLPDRPNRLKRWIGKLMGLFKRAS